MLVPSLPPTWRWEPAVEPPAREDHNIIIQHLVLVSQSDTHSHQAPAYIPLSTLHPPQFLQNNIFYAESHFSPSLAPSLLPSLPGRPKIFVWLNQVRADFHHNNYNWERQEVHPFVLSNFKMSQLVGASVIPGWNQAKLQQRAGHISNAAKWKPRKCSCQRCIFGAVHLFSLNPSPVTLMVTSQWSQFLTINSGSIMYSE